MKIFTFVFALILLAPLAAATPLDYYETVVNLDKEVSSFTFIFLFEEAPDGNMEYLLPFYIKDFKTNANFGNYTCEFLPKSWGSLIKCDFSQVKEGGRALNIKFSTSETIREIEDEILFSVNVKTPQDVKKMILKVILEKGYILIEEPEGSTTKVPYSPKDGNEGSDGRRIFIEWERKDVKGGEGIDVSVTYERILPRVGGNQNIIFLMIGLLILVIIMLVGIRSKGKQYLDTSILKENEKKVIGIIKEKGGMCKQRAIVRETDFSKAKVSRLVKDLEERGLIKTEKEGRSKKIYIKKKD
ncbi:MAG: MarR family transcriptional regulator [Candidatus Aenigmarchaeota archaeon]|nr:MarR family transcriptional regulator [Candidatus Aenigmarchaeota archaeon]